jgi:hypothetical protein
MSTKEYLQINGRGKFAIAPHKLDYIRYSKAALTPMSPYQDDDFSKAYTTALYQTKGTFKKRNEIFTEEQKPFTWILVTGCSKKIL